MQHAGLIHATPSACELRQKRAFMRARSPLLYAQLTRTHTRIIFRSSALPVIALVIDFGMRVRFLPRFRAGKRSDKWWTSHRDNADSSVNRINNIRRQINTLPRARFVKSKKKDIPRRSKVTSNETFISEGKRASLGLLSHLRDIWVVLDNKCIYT